MSTVEQHDTATELDSLTEEINRIELSRERKADIAPTGFDPAALFLLDLAWDNLFERIDQGGVNWRCKGCQGQVRFNKRQPHHAAHKRAVAKRTAHPYRDTRKPATGKKGETTTMNEGVSKTKLARDAAVAVLVKAGRPMKADEIVLEALNDAQVKAANVSKGTIATQISREVNGQQSRITRVEKGVYQAKEATSA